MPLVNIARQPPESTCGALIDCAGIKVALLILTLISFGRLLRKGFLGSVQGPFPRFYLGSVASEARPHFHRHSFWISTPFAALLCPTSLLAVL